MVIRWCKGVQRFGAAYKVTPAKFLEETRRKNKRVVVFEDGSRLYDACFQEGVDVLLNPRNGGLAWNMLGEFDAYTTPGDVLCYNFVR